MTDRPLRHPPGASADTGSLFRSPTCHLAALAGLMVGALCATLPAAAADDVPSDMSEFRHIDPDTGFRTQRYRAPVPDSVPGGTTLDTDAALAAHETGAMIFIDVYPAAGVGHDPLDGSWLFNETHHTLPSAIWLPEIGRGFLESAHVDYFRRNLDRLSEGQTDRAIVFFCQSDCWQGWNAAKRAADWGYTNIHWYPLGVDGWLEIGRELVPARPVNFFDDTTPTHIPDNATEADVDETDASPFPESARIELVDGHGQALDIGEVQFLPTDDHGTTAIVVEVDGAAFSDHFLSMRPFRCIADAPEWYCHLPYPYELPGLVTPDDLTDLEYQLLFIAKAASEFGIDAWNGLYYQLRLDDDGTIVGALLQGDLNVLAEPPEPNSYPIDLDEFIADDADARRYPALRIAP